MKKFIIIFVGLILLASLIFLLIQNNKLRGTIKSMDEFTFATHITADSLQSSIKSKIFQEAFDLIDSIHFMILQNSGGISQTGSSVNSNNQKYPDEVLQEYQYRYRLINNLTKIDSILNNKDDKDIINYLIKNVWEADSYNNSVALISQRLMYTKLIIIKVGLDM